MLLHSPCLSLQLRSIPVKSAEDDELEEEADWIYRNAFATPTISLQVTILSPDVWECPSAAGLALGILPRLCNGTGSTHRKLGL